MNSPNPELMELYGTDEYYLEKIGFLGSNMLLSGLRAGAGLGSIYAARAQAKHHDQLAIEAAQLNQHFRLLEARKMATVVESFGGPHDPAASLMPLSKTSSLDPRLEKIAMSLGSSIAYQEMDKEALPSIGQAVGLGKSLFGKATAGVGKAVQSVGTGIFGSGQAGRMLSAGGSAGLKMPAVQRVGLSMNRTGANLAATGKNVAQKGSAQLADASLPAWERASALAPKPAAAGKATTTSLKSPAAGQAAISPGFKPPGVDFYPGTPGAAGMAGPPIPDPKPAPLTSAAPATPTAGAPATTPTAPAKDKPWISTGTKIKAGLGLAGAGVLGTAGLVGAKGLQEVGDYMRTPSYTGGTWGGYGPSPVHNVNPYGYV